MTSLIKFRGIPGLPYLSVSNYDNLNVYPYISPSDFGIGYANIDGVLNYSDGTTWTSVAKQIVVWENPGLYSIIAVNTIVLQLMVGAGGGGGGGFFGTGNPGNGADGSNGSAYYNLNLNIQAGETLVGEITSGGAGGTGGASPTAGSAGGYTTLTMTSPIRPGWTLSRAGGAGGAAGISTGGPGSVGDALDGIPGAASGLGGGGGHYGLSGIDAGAGNGAPGNDGCIILLLR